MVIMMVMDDDWNFVYQSVLLLPISRFNVTKVRRRKASRCSLGFSLSLGDINQDIVLGLYFSVSMCRAGRYLVAKSARRLELLES